MGGPDEKWFLRFRIDLVDVETIEIMACISTAVGVTPVERNFMNRLPSSQNFSTSKFI